MAKAQRRVAKKSSKRPKTGRTRARKKPAKRAASKKVKSKVRAARSGIASKARKKRSSKTPTRAIRKPPRQTGHPPVEASNVGIIDEPAPGAVRVDEYEAIRTVPADPDTDDTEE